MPKLYQHVSVQAEQYDGTNNPFERLAESKPVPFLQTQHGIVPVVIGDWIVRVERGVYEAVKPDVFGRLFAEYVPPPPEPVPPVEHIDIPIDWDDEDEEASV